MSPYTKKRYVDYLSEAPCDILDLGEKPKQRAETGEVSGKAWRQVIFPIAHFLLVISNLSKHFWCQDEAFVTLLTRIMGSVWTIVGTRMWGRALCGSSISEAETGTRDKQ